MRRPRLQFTIGRLMVMVLVLGLSLGGAVFLRPLFDQIAIERKAQTSYRQAKLVRQVAEYALEEYMRRIYPQNKATSMGQVVLAEADRARAIDRLEWSNRMRAKGFVSKATNIADGLAKQKAEFDLEQAKTQLEVLEKYTKEKRIKSLTSSLEKAKADEQAKLASYRMEQSRRWRIFGL
jgi:HlyD family secretion protein